MTPADIHWSIRRLDSAEAELWISAPAPLTGRLVGPRCRYASTVEVAHYLKPLSPGIIAPAGTQRIIVPEPSFWEPTTPFIYTGHFRSGDEKVAVTIGLCTLGLAADGLRVNRHAFRLRGTWCDSTPDWETLRQAGINTLVVPVTPENASWWSQADDWGFFMLGRIEDLHGLELAEALKTRPSCVGWLVRDDLEEPARLQSAPGRTPLLGLLRPGPSPRPVPDWCQFVTSIDRVTNRPWLALNTEGDDRSMGAVQCPRLSILGQGEVR